MAIEKPRAQVSEDRVLVGSHLTRNPKTIRGAALHSTRAYLQEEEEEEASDLRSDGVILWETAPSKLDEGERRATVQVTVWKAQMPSGSACP